MANLIDAGMSAVHENLKRINDSSSYFDISVLRFMRIFKRYFAKYKLELVYKFTEKISDNEFQSLLFGIEKFLIVLKGFLSKTMTHYEYFIKYAEKITKFSEEMNKELENVNDDLLMIYRGLIKYNHFISVHNTMISNFNSFKSDLKLDIIGQINQFMNEFDSFNVERNIYSLKINLILKTLENFKRRLKLISQVSELPLVEPVNQLILDELISTIDESNA